MSDLFLQSAAVLQSTAVLSLDNLYRYRLGRVWDAERPAAVWIMLNPSTADALADDPTIRRCVRFAAGWGCGGIGVVNLFAARATKPSGLKQYANPVGPLNDQHIQQAILSRPLCRVIAAWGAHEAARGRTGEVMKLVREAWPGQVECLGLTKDGFPRHPLYVPASQPLEPFGRMAKERAV